jgi:peptidoglycan pentaglycine glycine transferase (the first glycine)
MQVFTGSSTEWNALISQLHEAHFLQSWEWAQVKEKYGWKPMPFVWKDNAGQTVAAAMILKRQILNRGFAARVCILYAPKGPLLDWNNEVLRSRVLNDLQSFAKKQGAIFFKMDPDVVLGRGVPNTEGDVIDGNGQAVVSDLTRRGWEYSSEQIQFKNTVIVDLSPTEEEMMARMKQKTRYNVRLAEKKGVNLRVGNLDDLPMLYKMYAETSVRDGFVIRDENYYKTVWGTFMRSAASGQPFAVPLIAEVDGEPVAAIFLFMFAGRAWYVYGMSRDAHREKMPTYLLQWEAMKHAKSAGCAVYYLWGAPDEFNESDSMWGVYRFKEGLGGEVARTLGAWDHTPNKLLYKFYTEVMPRILDVMRSRGRSKTRQSLGDSV